MPRIDSPPTHCPPFLSAGANGPPVDPAGFPGFNNARKCLYCAPPPPACKAAGTCGVREAEYVGIADRLELWDGRMWDGTFVFDADRCVQ